MSKLQECSDVEVEVSKNFLACIRPEDVPKHFALVIHQGTSHAFWVEAGGLGYSGLNDIATSKGPVERKLLPVNESITDLVLAEDWLAALTATRILIFQVSILLKENDACQPLVIASSKVDRLCACEEYLLYLDAQKSLVAVKWGSMEGRRMNDSQYISVTEVSGNKVWVIDATKVTLECLEVPSGKVLSSIDPPEDLPQANGPDAILHAASPDLVVIGLKSTMIIMHLRDSKPCWYIWNDPVRGYEDGELIFASVPRWCDKRGELVLVGDTTSLDIGCAGVTDDFHSYFLTNEEFLIQMPFVKAEETYPRAIAIDYTSAEAVEPCNQDGSLLPPQPIVWIINSAGYFCPFRIVITDKVDAHPLMKHKTIEIPVFSLNSNEQASVAEPKSPQAAETPGDSLGPAIEEQEEEAPILLPMLSKLTEDHGLITNAIAAEFLDLYTAFNEDLDRVRSVIVGVNVAITTNKEHIDRLHDITTPSLAKLCDTLDKELSLAVEKEKRMMHNFQRLVDLQMSIKSRSARSYAESLQELSNSLDAVETLISKFEGVADAGARRSFLCKDVLPALEAALDSITSKTESTDSVTFNPKSSPRWSRLLTSLRQRQPRDIVSAETKRQEVIRAQMEPSNVKIACTPLPEPFSLPKINLVTPKLPGRIDVKATSLGSIFAAENVATKAGPTAETSPSLSTAPESKSTRDTISVGAKSKTISSLPSTSFVKPAAFSFALKSEKSSPSTNLSSMSELPESGKPQPLASPTPPKPTAYKQEKKGGSFVLEMPDSQDLDRGGTDGSDPSGDKSKSNSAPFNFSFKPFTSPTSSSGDSAKSDETLATKSSTASGLFSFGFGGSPNPSTQGSIVAGHPENVRAIIHEDAPPMMPDSPSKIIHDGDVGAGSPTPKGRRGSVGEKEGEGHSLGRLSLGIDGSATKLNALPSLFSVPAIVTEMAPSQPSEVSATITTDKAEQTSGFRPSVLASMEPPPASIFKGGSGFSSNFETPFSTPSKPGMSGASLGGTTGTSSFGSASLFAAQPTFGAPAAFGMPLGAPKPAFGHTTSFGTNPLVPPPLHSSSSAATLSGGFSAFSSGSGFAAYATTNAPANASLFGAASSVDASQSGEEKKKLPSSFTQFRS